MKKIAKWLNENLEIYISIILISSMTMLIFIQVVMRYVFKNSLSWSEELARYMFVWLIYLSISYGAKIRKHIKIEAFMKMFPEKGRKYIVIMGDCLFLIFAIIIVITSSELVQKQIMLGQTSPALHIPMAFIYAAPMVGFAMTAFRQIQTIYYRIQVLKGKAVELDG